MLKLCKCGCGNVADRGDWKWSHWLIGKKFPGTNKGKKHFLGKKHSEETKKKIGETLSKGSHWQIGLKSEDSPFWKGGKNRPEAKMYRRMRRMIHRTLDQCFNVKKPWRTYQLGYTPQQLKEHLEKLWKLGMSWENYGKGEGKWQIDHVRPVTSFPLDSSPAEVNSLVNLQPLWYHENMGKFNHWEI